MGLLSIGEEDAKGNTLTREARKFMRDEPLINFVGQRHLIETLLDRDLISSGGAVDNASRRRSSR